MAMPPAPTTLSEFREVAIEVNRLARILQGTVSLECQGMDKREYRAIKRQILERLRRTH
jgi:hypothetical protein